MATWAFPSSARRVIPPLRQLLTRLAPVVPVLKNLVSIPLTVAGIGCIDCGVFLANTIAGFIVTGLSLMWLEHLLADE